MITPGTNTPFVAIACGGTGGHLFPGLTVAEQLQKCGCAVALLVSPKEVDQQAVKSAHGMEVFTLPAVALQNRNYFSFARSFWQSWRASRKIFKARPPHAVLAMGGFTSAPPILAAEKIGAKTFLHESNTIPGRANRLLARFVDEAFAGFPESAPRLRARKVTITGTPVRSRFQPRDAAECRAALGLDPNRPTILVMGGSQGASGLNEMILSALPTLGENAKSWQWLHLTGATDFEKVKQTYATRGFNAFVKPFLAEMDLALNAATVCVCRSGASSLAEIAAMRLPSLLVPYPTAADDHQFHNARAFETTGAARLLEQKNATPEKVSALLRELVENEAARAAMQTALVQWYAPKAADQIAENILSAIEHETADKVEGHSRPRVSRSTPRRTHSDETDSIAV
ncbi:MAG: undecaprenyldiphospho-muramoylpentapeptide beta-N-acetylglucosaminyltransferase [Verrucomicrobiota bacterium]|jgi:UDP-N-acetylglucosamine--N-acetylmuramyl-(pentapeptide) pyrophosphoryl-undecaprenol N-acetylglucosamine transferase